MAYISSHRDQLRVEALTETHGHAIIAGPDKRVIKIVETSGVFNRAVVHSEIIYNSGSRKTVYRDRYTVMDSPEEIATLLRQAGFDAPEIREGIGKKISAAGIRVYENCLWGFHAHH